MTLVFCISIEYILRMDVSEMNTEGLPGLASRRKAASLTQDLLAQRAGLHRVTIASYESGIQDPGLAIVRRLATILGCTVADLVTAPQEEADLFRAEAQADG